MTDYDVTRYGAIIGINLLTINQLLYIFLVLATRYGEIVGNNLLQTTLSLTRINYQGNSNSLSGIVRTRNVLASNVVPSPNS